MNPYFRLLTGLCLVALASALISSCTINRPELGTEGNPIRFFLVPSVDAQMLESKGVLVQRYLEKHTPYKYRFAVPASYVAVVEAFGTRRADVAALNTFGYLVANERYQTEARIAFVRHGSETYSAQIVARADGPINSVEDIDGRRFAYVDPASTSGYILPARLFRERGITPSDTVFAKRHDNVITMIYQGQVDAGATFYTPPQDGKIEDARRLVLTQFPDVEEKIKIVELTDEIPNDPIVFRAELPEEMKESIVSALLQYMETDEGKDTFRALYGISSMVRTTDSRYDEVRKMLLDLGRSAADLMQN